MKESILLCVLFSIAVLATSGCARRPIVKLQSDSTQFAMRAPSSVAFQQLRRGSPPIAELYFEIVLRNQRDEPRWFLLPRFLTANRSPIGTNGGVDGLEVVAFAGAGRAIIGRFYGTAGFQALLLPRQSQVRVRGFPITYSGDVPERVDIEIVIAESVSIGGKDILAWFANDPTSSDSADVGDGLTEPVLVESRRPHGVPAMAVAIVDDRRIVHSVWLEQTR